MSVTIAVHDDIEAALRRRAEAEHCSAEQRALEILAGALDVDDGGPSVEEVVAEIMAAPPNPAAIRRAEGSLAEVLQRYPPDLAFDGAAWDAQWAAVEAEMKGITRANDIAKGRGWSR